MYLTYIVSILDVAFVFFQKKGLTSVTPALIRAYSCSILWRVICGPRDSTLSAVPMQAPNYFSDPNRTRFCRKSSITFQGLLFKMIKSWMIPYNVIDLEIFKRSQTGLFSAKRK